MPLTLDAGSVVLRLALAVMAGALLGVNRGSQGEAAGLRTTVLVCVAACASMIQVNLLLVLAEQRQSLVELDLMRLPLGILSGMGFIGAGAIMRKGQVVRGVTTAATLWFVTVMGLCLGGGQIALGLELLGIGLVVLWLLMRIERRYLFEHRAVLVVTASGSGLTEADLRGRLRAADLHVARCATSRGDGGRRTFKIAVRWRTHAGENATPDIVDGLLETAGVTRVKWEPIR